MVTNFASGDVNSRGRLRTTLVVGWCSLVGLAMLGVPLRADDTYATSAARLREMTPDQKDDLRRKKLRFDELSPEDKQRLRDLHQSITSDANSQELLDTAVGYNRWLATLDATERSLLLDIKDPHSRIERIKELIQQQEARRFQQYFTNLPEKDREAVFKWLEGFLVAHADAITHRLPHDARQRLAEAADEDAKKRALLGGWLRFRRAFDLPWPGSDDQMQLLKQLSSETQKMIESSAASDLAKEPEEQRTPERQQVFQQRRVEDLVRTAIYSRVFPQISQDELLKYYAAMKADDPRRRQLEGREGEDLRRELQRFYNYDHGYGRGGPGGPPGSRGGYGPPGWPGSRGEGPPRGDGPPPARGK